MIHLFNEDGNTLDVVKMNGNSLVFSSLRQFYEPVKSEGFAIKYVVEGIERYQLNGHSYPIAAGDYLLTNDTCEGKVEVDENRNVKGICINISPRLIAEVIAGWKRPDTAFSDAELGNFFVSAHFFESGYRDNETQLGHYLRQLTATVRSGLAEQDSISDEFFYTIAEKIIQDQLPVFRHLRAIPGVKPDTRKDLYRRVQKGRDYINACFMLPLSIKTIAQEACLSEYHFYRLFKAVFGMSPNQYIIKKRLEFGKSILLQHRYAVSEAATQSGFADIHTFSKAFKRYFGFPPSAFLKGKRT
ncbi:AraC family transcriptional regulator [Emticicia fluvialis]|uniref:AraC family transcriptional regulator n=1 Tax=Emticicia fluvialis TaxID=2974474 RepID=UPI002165F226|nr:AraC family transcriptional regulator [Emticicia fluvialis]